MASKQVRRACQMLGVLAAVSASQALGCGGCPDLAVQAFEFEVTGGDPGEILITVTNEADSSVPCAATAVAEHCVAPEGSYTITFSSGGQQFGELNGVCTAGDATGCAAEDAQAKGDPPLIAIVRGAGGWSVTLERQGPCP